MSAQITKISLKGGDVHIVTEEEKNGDTIKTDLDSDQPPNPEFKDAITDLGLYMFDMMEFPEAWKDKAECRGVTINYEEDERIGAVVVMYVPLSKFNAGVSISSPHLREKLPGTPDGGCFMPPKMVDLVKELRNEAQKYIYGDRAQRELLADDKDDSGEGAAGDRVPNARNDHREEGVPHIVFGERCQAGR